MTNAPDVPEDDGDASADLPAVDIDIDAVAWRATARMQQRGEGAPDEPYDPDERSLGLDPEDTTASFGGEVPELLDEVVRYEMRGEIARGGMGAIHEVHDKDLRRNLAMKVILTSKRGSGGGSSAVSPDVLRRFLEEAQITAQLAHPGVVPIHELGVDGDGRTYFTMSRVHGETLSQVIKKARAGTSGWSINRALQVIQRVCETMAFAHRKGVVHRDIKPANVMVGRFGQTYVMDWGLAKVLGREDSHDLRIKEEVVSTNNAVPGISDRYAPMTTMDGVVIGTPAFMPPEQAEGRITDIDKRSDVYAIGAMLYQLLTGTAPYLTPGKRALANDVLVAVIGGPPPKVETLDPTAPPEVQAICEKAMARNPADRYASAEELAEDLRNYLTGYVVRAHKTGLLIEIKKWFRRNTAVALTAVAALLVLTVGGVYYTVNLSAARDAADAAALRESDRAKEAVAARGEAVAAERRAAQRAEEAVAARGEAVAAERRAAQRAEEAVAARGEAVAAEKRAAQRAEEAERARDAKAVALRKARALGLIAASAEAESVDAMTGLHLARAAVRTLEEPRTVRRLRAAIAASHERAVLEGHDRGLDAAAFSPDGTRIATVSTDGTTRLWDAEGEALLVIQGGGEARRDTDPVRRSREGPVAWVSFAPDGSRVISSSFDDTARIVALGGNEVAVLQGHAGPIMSGEYSPDGARIVTASRDGTARTWDADGKSLATLQGHGHAVWSATFSPDGSRIVTASQDGKGGIWSAEGHAIASLDGHDGPVRTARYSYDGTRIVTASLDGTARVWDAEGRETAVLRGHDVEAGVWSAEFSPDGELVLTSSWDGTGRLWDLTGKEVAVLRGHELPLLSAVFSPDGSRIVTTSFDGSARLWDTGGRLVGALRGHTHLVASARFSPDGARVVTASNDKTARLWSVEGGELAVLRGHELEVPCGAYSSDGAHIVTASWDGTARVWTAEGRLLTVIRGHDAALWSAAFSPDGERIVTASYDRTARIWGIDGEEQLVISGHEDTVLDANFSPDGLRVVTSSSDKTARIWSSNGEEVAVLQGHEEAVWSAAYSPDGTHIVTASWDKTARVWDARGTELAVLRGHDGRVSSAAFSHDGTRIVTASWDRTARIWDLEGNELEVLRGHEHVVWSASFSDDGKYVATASGDKTARVWGAEGNRVTMLLGHDAPVRSIAISPGSQRILTTSEDMTGRVWLVRTDEVLALADRRVTRELSPEDLERYAPLLDDE